MIFRSVVPAVAAVFMAGCEFSSVPVGPTRHDSQSVELDKSEMARVELRMGAGNLNLQGGSAKFVEADFTYNVDSWKPEFRYTNTGVRGDLVIEQPSHSGAHHGSTTYRWDVRLNAEKPVDLSIKFGAGEADLNLGSLAIRSLDVNMGVGTMKMDLRGNPKRSYDVRIRGGVGEATVYLPKDVGIEADAQGGIGGISAPGLRKEDGRYVNDAYATAKTKIHLNIRGGIGSINLIAD